MTTKEKFKTYLREHGYKSIKQLCSQCGLNPTFLYSNIRGKNGISVDKIFLIANTMKVPVDELLRVFYEEQYIENERIVGSCKSMNGTNSSYSIEEYDESIDDGLTDEDIRKFRSLYKAVEQDDITEDDLNNYDYLNYLDDMYDGEI